LGDGILAILNENGERSALPVATRTTPPPPLNKEAEAAFIAKVKTLARKIPNRFAPFGRD